MVHQLLKTQVSGNRDFNLFIHFTNVIESLSNFALRMWDIYIYIIKQAKIPALVELTFTVIVVMFV